MRRVALAVVLVAVLPAPAAASGDLWATINVCDTRARPDTIGIRGSMPALGKRTTRMFMRVRVQYLAAGSTWRDVAPNGDSGWLRLGRARGRVLSVGQNFRFLPPGGGGAHRLRGVVTFKWLAARRDAVLRRARRVTTSGHRSNGADPPGYSAAICDIT